jgi:hypothetical protein
MNDCERLSERMPAVAGGGRWAADEAAHLAACRGCAAEWALIRSAQALGSDVVARLRPDHVTDRVLGRLRLERAAARDRWRGLVVAGLAAAAAVAVVVSTRNPAESGSGSTLDVASVNLVLPELDSLGAPELEALLRTMDRPSDDSAIDLVPVFPEDLESGDLEGVLEALEG